MKNPSTFLAALALIPLLVSFGDAWANCVFSNGVNESKFRNDREISRYVWDQDTRAAKIISKANELISVRYWACDHYGAHAVMLEGPYPKDDASDVGKRFVQLADRAFGSDEAKTVRNYVRKNPVLLSGDTRQINIPNTGYSEFYLRYSVVYDSLVVEIKFYKD